MKIPGVSPQLQEGGGVKSTAGLNLGSFNEKMLEGDSELMLEKRSNLRG